MPWKRSGLSARRPADGSGWWVRCRRGSLLRRYPVAGCWRRPVWPSRSTRAGPGRRLGSRPASRSCVHSLEREGDRVMATGQDREDEVRAERARAVGLFRYSLIREAADPTLSTKQRGRLVRALASREHVGPFGDPVRVSRETIDRWIRDWH